ncbi:serine/threonine protein kinase [Bacillus sp. CGMCC 1.16541]|uniref:serine/threonine protein kinase n=1 Tax=Bacillus sp. CGMCC 1.16541 TaxID=2185143 RepID=UPI000D734FC7|nr:serine/threonine protein kinase [Bacillus sp. CGMCC 1.16541]
MEKELFHELVKETLLPYLQISSDRLHEPVVVTNTPQYWKCIGVGNYAAVFEHQDYENWVVKVYSREPQQIKQEVKVYKQLGIHPAYSELIGYGENYLILKKLKGVTLYEAVHQGIPIPEQVIKDVSEALDYARKRGLNPFDIHGKNVMMKENRGYVVDVSDFYKSGIDRKWRDLVKAYYKVYVPFFYKYNIRIPYFLLNGVRRGYRLYRTIKRKKNVHK